MNPGLMRHMELQTDSRRSNAWRDRSEGWNRDIDDIGWIPAIGLFLTKFQIFGLPFYFRTSKGFWRRLISHLLLSRTAYFRTLIFIFIFRSTIQNLDPQLWYVFWQKSKGQQETYHFSLDNRKLLEACKISIFQSTNNPVNFVSTLKLSDRSCKINISIYENLVWIFK